MFEWLNPFRKRLRDQFAREALATCRVYGDFLPFQNRATDSIVWVWTIPDEERRIMKPDGALEVEQTLRDFFIPRQSVCSCGVKRCDCSNKKEFPPEGEPSIGSLIKLGNYEYDMDSFERDSVGAAFTFHCIRKLPRRIEMDQENG